MGGQHASPQVDGKRFARLPPRALRPVFCVVVRRSNAGKKNKRRGKGLHEAARVTETASRQAITVNLCTRVEY